MNCVALAAVIFAYTNLSYVYLYPGIYKKSNTCTQNSNTTSCANKRSHARYRIIQCALATLIPEHRRSDRARELVVARSAEKNQCK